MGSLRITYANKVNCANVMLIILMLIMFMMNLR